MTLKNHSSETYIPFDKNVPIRKQLKGAIRLSFTLLVALLLLFIPVSAQAGGGAITGTWHWDTTGGKVCIHTDGTIEHWNPSKDATGIWTTSGTTYTKYTLNWLSNGNIDNLYLPSDGQSLDGFNQNNIHVTATRSSDTPPFGCQTGGGTIVGTWQWKTTGGKVCIQPDGTIEHWDGYKDATGIWTTSGTTYTGYTLNWLSNGYIDTLYVPSGGQSLDGSNQYSTHVTATKTSISTDPPLGCQQCSPVGGWSWFNGETKFVHPDGTYDSCENGVRHDWGTWEMSDPSKGTFLMRERQGGPGGEYVDPVTMASDCKSLSGTSAAGIAITATRYSDSDTLPSNLCRKESTGGAITGTYHWDTTGGKVCILPDGTLEHWNPTKDASGTWTQSGNTYTLNWVSNGYVDQLSLASDGQSLDGSNQYGTHVTATKISNSPTDCRQQKPEPPKPPVSEPPKPPIDFTSGGGGGSCTNPTTCPGMSGHPWDTAVGQNCFEQWISEATSRANAYTGNTKTNELKPWSINKYGLDVDTLTHSAFEPDVFPLCGNNKYWYMWVYPPLSNPNYFAGAGIPNLRDYVCSCIARAGGTSTGPGTGTGTGGTGTGSIQTGSLNPPGQGCKEGVTSLYVDYRSMNPGQDVIIPIVMCNARDVANMDLSVTYDSSVLKFKSAVKGSLNANTLFESNNVGNTLKIAFAGKMGFSGTGSIAILTFTVIGKTGSSSPITIKVNEASTSSGTPVNPEVQNGQVRVGNTNPNNPSGWPGGPKELDAWIALRMSVGKLAVDMNYDLTKDGKVTSSDARAILQQVEM